MAQTTGTPKPKWAVSNGQWISNCNTYAMIKREQSSTNKNQRTELTHCISGQIRLLDLTQHSKVLTVIRDALKGQLLTPHHCSSLMREQQFPSRGNASTDTNGGRPNWSSCDVLAKVPCVGMVKAVTGNYIPCCVKCNKEAESRGLDIEQPGRFRIMLADSTYHKQNQSNQSNPIFGGSTCQQVLAKSVGAI